VAQLDCNGIKTQNQYLTTKKTKKEDAKMGIFLQGFWGKNVVYKVG
jgi:hypothetical protein